MDFELNLEVEYNIVKENSQKFVLNIILNTQCHGYNGILMNSFKNIILKQFKIVLQL